jgi:hypothetical protein
MSQDDYQLLYLWLLSLLIGLVAIAIPGYWLYRRDTISRQMLRYLVYPLAVLPFSAMVTITIFPDMSLVLRLMIAIGVVTLSFLYVYLVREPLTARIFPRLREDRKHTNKDERP